jgi:hypothetical protein
MDEDSNLTPRASNEGFVANIIRKESKLAICKKKKINLTYQTPQTTQGSKDYDKMTLEKTIDKITTSLSRPYFNKILKQLASTNLENAMIICNYILTEQTEINIKNSTKEGKIKVLVWLSNYFNDRISFKGLSKLGILGPSILNHFFYEYKFRIFLFKSLIIYCQLFFHRKDVNIAGGPGVSANLGTAANAGDHPTETYS